MRTHPRLVVARFLGAPAALPTLIALLLAALLLNGVGSAGPAGAGTGEEPTVTDTSTPTGSPLDAVRSASGSVRLRPVA